MNTPAYFLWKADCEAAFETLKSKLLIAPVLVYPDFNRSFILETDTPASKVLVSSYHSSKQTTDYTLWLTLVSRYQQRKQTMQLLTWKTLAAVWAITHLRYYLYGHDVTIITDHSAVKAILEAPN